MLKFFYVLLLLLYSNAQALTRIVDDEIEGVVRDIAKPIFKAAKLDNAGIKVIILGDKSINAFVNDNNHVYVNSGLLNFSDNPEVVAGVIAHECGHIALGHVASRSELAKLAQSKIIAAYVLGAAAAILGKSPEVGLGVISAGSHAVAVDYFSHSRVHETQADMAALKYLESAKFSYEGLLEILKYFNANERIFFKDQNPYIITHPVSKNRIELIKNSNAEVDSNLSNKRDLNDRYKMATAKLYAFTNSYQAVTNRYNQQTKYDLYARSIAEYRKGNIKKALEILDSLVKLEPKNPHLIELKGQFLYENGKIGESIGFYEKALAMLPYSTSIKIELAAALTQIRNREKQAVPMLQSILELEPDNAAAWKILGVALDKSGSNDQARIAFTQYYLQLGDHKTANRFFNSIKENGESLPKFYKTRYQELKDELSSPK
jgi:predicted Zn-dependent protease